MQVPVAKIYFSEEDKKAKPSLVAVRNMPEKRHLFDMP